jgi:hypothetical protein
MQKAFIHKALRGNQNTKIIGTDANGNIIYESKAAANGLATLDGTGKVPPEQLPAATTPALETITLSSGTANIIINNENPANIAGSTTPTTIAVDSTNSILSKGRVLTVIGNGSTTPSITGATKYPNDAGAYVTTNGTMNKIWFSCDVNSTGVKTVYYIFR